MRAMRMWRAALLAGVASVVACRQATGTADDLRIGFTVQGITVRPGDPMLARLVITNPTSDTIAVSSGDSCVATLDALRDGERVDLQGTAFGCLTVISNFRIPPGDSIVREFDLVAMLRENQSPWRYVVPPQPGTYRLRADMHVHLPDEYVTFEVVP
jgi:hypothetical protein